MKILLQNKNFVIANNSLITIDSNNIAENGSLVRVKQASKKSDILKINNSLVRAKITSDLPIVPKGTLIYMNLDGTSRQYRVLSVNGNVCKVMGMWDNVTSVYNSTSTTTTFGSTTTQKYDGSTLDTYLNTTWYNTLSIETKNAIVPENVVQYCYKYYNEPNTPNTPTYTYQYQYNWSDSGYDNVDNVGSVTVGKRNVFALDLKDIFDYIGKVCITSNELMIMFWNSTTGVSKHSWLRSSVADKSNCVWTVNGYNGNLLNRNVVNSYVMRPALNLDLSKIEWSTTEPIVNNTETWVINSNYSSTASISANVKFKSNNISYNSISIQIAPVGNRYIKYDNTTACNIMANITSNFVVEASWTNEAYCTIILDEPATGDLLTWLKNNAVKQEK